jgi:uncharacterized protein (TIGR02099 family)
VFLKTCFTVAKHCSLWAYRITTLAVVAVGLLFVALVLALRYVVLPNINDYREPIASAITKAAGQRVTIGSIAGSWQGYRPELNLQDVKVYGANDQPALALERVETVLSWFSLLSAELRFDTLSAFAPSLEVRRDVNGVIWIAGVAMSPASGQGGLADWLLKQRQIVVRDATIVWLDETRAAPRLAFGHVDFRLDRVGALHRFGLTATPPPELSSVLVARGEFTGTSLLELQSLKGRVYADIGYVNLALARLWIPAPVEIASGLGAMRLWFELDGGRLGSATADVKLVNVQARLAPGLPDLTLAEAHGRLAWTDHGERSEMSAEAFGFTTLDGLKLASTRMTYARVAPANGKLRSEVRLAGFDLAPVAQLVEFFPIDPTLRGRLRQAAPTGRIEEANFSWEGEWGTDSPYTANARFTALAVRPDGALPGIRGLSGHVEANEGGGTAALEVKSGAIELPKVFSEAVPLDFFTANAGWTRHDGTVDVEIKNASFANVHAAGSVAGSYHGPKTVNGEVDGAGSIDLNGVLVRAEARDVWRYIPIAIPVTQAWLKQALLAGESRDVRFRLKGPLKEFPFPNDRNGVFEVVAKVTGATLDYAPGWPPVTALNGDAVFRGSRMEIRSKGGAIFGLRLPEVTATIPDLINHDQVLRVEGVAEGPTADFLRFVATSPVTTQINRFTQDMKATGDAKLDLVLDLPLHRTKEAKVKGTLLVQNNGVVLDPRLPPFENFGARIAFTERDFAVSDGRALMFGEPLSFAAANQADGAITANVAGTLDMEAARILWPHPMLAYFDGQTQWRGSISVRNKIATIRFDSTLDGVKSTLPAPLGKSASTSMPLRVELRERPGRQGILSINLDKVASAQLLLDGSAASGIGRGTINLGGQATLPKESGLWIRGNLDAVDLDAWQAVQSGLKHDDSPSPLAGIDLRVGSLDVSRRRFHDLRVEASRDGDNWDATLTSDQVAGDVTWSPAGDGKVEARLTRLALPAAAAQTEIGKPATNADSRLPSVDLIADSFNFEGRELGRLTVLAAPETSGWRLQRLEFVNPDSKFSMNGRWVIAEVSRTDVNVLLDVSDVGKFFARMGWPDAMQGGTATIEGPLAWTGNPTRFDIPSLSGQLKLEAKKGRFKQIEPGVGKLLGILSLQALPRRVTLDFRDVFSKGFSFDRISANTKIASGVAQTQDFLMLGSAARVAMQGNVDLGKETQDLVVRVTPSLSEGIAIAGAIVNPAIGVAALIAQKALKDPLSQIASFDYELTGTWADPNIKRVRKAPVVEKGGR